MPRATALEAAEHFEQVAAHLSTAPARVASIAAPFMLMSVLELFGKSPPLKALADSTQALRAAAGFAPNEPLERSGSLEDSWVAAVIDENIAAVGSADPRAPLHEHGYYNVEAGRMVAPRPVGYMGVNAAIPTVKKLWFHTIGRAIEGRE